MSQIPENNARRWKSESIKITRFLWNLFWEYKI